MRSYVVLRYVVLCIVVHMVKCTSDTLFQSSSSLPAIRTWTEGGIVFQQVGDIVNACTGNGYCFGYRLFDQGSTNHLAYLAGNDQTDPILATVKLRVNSRDGVPGCANIAAADPLPPQHVAPMIILTLLRDVVSILCGPMLAWLATQLVIRCYAKASAPVAAAQAAAPAQLGLVPAPAPAAVPPWRGGWQANHQHRPGTRLQLLLPDFPPFANGKGGR